MLGESFDVLRWVESIGALSLLAVVLWWMGKNLLVPIRDSHQTTLERLNKHLDVVDKSLVTISEAVKKGTEGHEHLENAVDEVKRDVRMIKDGLEQWKSQYQADRHQGG